ALFRRDGDHGISQAAGRDHRPGAAVAFPPRQHGCAAALHRADPVAAADPGLAALEGGRHARAVGPALCRDLGIRPLSLLLSARLLGVQSSGLAIAVRVRRLVRNGRRAAHATDPVIADHARGLLRLSVLLVPGDADLVRAAARPFHAAPARAMDVSDRQDRPRRAAVCAFFGAGGARCLLPAEGLAISEIALAPALDPVRAAFPGNLLPRRFPGLCRAFHPGRSRWRCRAARVNQPFRYCYYDGDGVADFMVQACRRQERLPQGRRRQRRSGGRRLMRSRSGIILCLAMLVAVSAAGSLRAEEAPVTCDVPDSLLSTESPLNKVADVIKANRPLDILVIVSRSSTIVSSDNSAYPARLQ